jgi:hypothetical protein
VGDCALMERAMSSTKPWSAPDIVARINRARLYLQVECLSEICDADGVELQHSMWNKNQPGVISRSTMLWPVQPCPGPKTWKVVWYRFLQRGFTHTTLGFTTRKLMMPLGHWTYLENIKWQVSYDYDTNKVAVLHEKNRPMAALPDW